VISHRFSTVRIATASPWSGWAHHGVGTHDELIKANGRYAHSLSSKPPAIADPRAAFLAAAFWHRRAGGRRGGARRLSDVRSSDIHTAATLGDDAAVRRFLAADPGTPQPRAAHATWMRSPICVSQLTCGSMRPRSDAFVRAATALLDAAPV